jgi:hypothetical protein
MVMGDTSVGDELVGSVVILLTFLCCIISTLYLKSISFLICEPDF